MILAILFCCILVSAKSQQSDATNHYHPFQAIDEAFILTGLDSQIIELTNRVEYLLLKKSKLISFAYCKDDTALLTIEESENGRVLVYRHHDIDNNQHKNTFQFPVNELPYKVKNCDSQPVVLTYSHKQSHAYALDQGKLGKKLFSINAFINDLFFNSADSFYYFCSGATIFKCKTGGIPVTVFEAKEKIYRLLLYQSEIMFSTSNCIYTIANNQLKRAYNRGGYFDVVDRQVFIWDKLLTVTPFGKQTSFWSDGL